MSKLDELDPIPETSTTGYTQRTPETEATEVGDAWNGHIYAVPWPGSSYIIFEHGTNRAITLEHGKVCLRNADENPSANNRWQCVEKQGYFGFYNLKSLVYMGHSGPDHRIVARAKEQKGWEQITPRKHPEGGYQLLFAYFEHTLMMLSVSNEGERLVRTNHGDSRWDFVKI
jgi:hypothetical protein